MTLVVRPIVRDDARAWVKRHHRHHPPFVSWLFGCAVFDGDRLCCVAAVERPARLLQDGVTCQVSRVASDRTPHAASKVIAAAARAALALGYRRVVSYTLTGEAGTCYRAAGWWPTAVTAGGEWSRPSRTRAAAAQPCPKVRWEFGPDAAPYDEMAEAYVLATLGWEPGQQLGLFGEGEAA